MAEQETGRRGARPTLIRAMGLVALSAVLLRWPPLALAAVPAALFLGVRWLGRVSSIGSAVVALLSAFFVVPGCLLWERSYRESDVLSWRSAASDGAIITSRGSVLGDLRPPSGPGPTGSLDLRYNRNGYLAPEWLDFPNHLVNLTLIPPEDGDEDRGGSWLGFGWFERRNPAWGGFIVARCAVPFWYLAAIAAAPPLGWASRRRRWGRDLP